MKLIALRDIARTPALEDMEIENAAHPRHIHAGATFDIGKAASLAELKGGDRELVALLFASNAAGDATDSKVVKAVQDEVSVNRRREERAAKANSSAALDGVSQQLSALVAKAAGVK